MSRTLGSFFLVLLFSSASSLALAQSRPQRRSQPPAETTETTTVDPEAQTPTEETVAPAAELPSIQIQDGDFSAFQRQLNRFARRNGVDAMTEEAMRVVFDAADADGNGRLDASELADTNQMPTSWIDLNERSRGTHE